MEERYKEKIEGRKVENIELMDLEDIDPEFRIPFEKLIEDTKRAIWSDTNPDWCCEKSISAAETNIQKAFALGYSYCIHYQSTTENDE